ncbi:MAG: Asp-tRNA(Asn)/Glu-tRNA(Gln) amidotransferase subunit GatC [Gemmatimonadales bacterium]
MTIGPDTVRHVARLAELAVADGDVDLLAAQLESIVDFVEQLATIDALPGTAVVNIGPPTLTLREDVVAPIPMTRLAADLAPEFAQGFFVVPRLGGMVDE